MELIVIQLVFAILTALIAYFKNYSGLLWFVLGLFFPAIALIVIVFFKEKLTAENAPPTLETHFKCPECRELVRKDALKCKHCGCELFKDTTHNRNKEGLSENKQIGENIWKKERDIKNDEYQVHLVKKYSIEKNEALNKIIANGKLFDTIEDAISAVDRIENDEQIEFSKLKNSKDYVKTSGTLGRGSYQYSEYGDGSVTATHQNGLTIKFKSVEDAKNNLGE
jgi:hypothetical protein